MKPLLLEQNSVINGLLQDVKELQIKKLVSLTKVRSAGTISVSAEAALYRSY